MESRPLKMTILVRRLHLTIIGNIAKSRYRQWDLLFYSRKLAAMKRRWSGNQIRLFSTLINIHRDILLWD